VSDPIWAIYRGFVRAEVADCDALVLYRLVSIESTRWVDLQYSECQSRN